MGELNWIIGFKTRLQNLELFFFLARKSIERRMERSGEDSKAFDPSIVKFSYKFLLDVIQRPHPAVHKAGRDVVGEDVYPERVEKRGKATGGG